MLGSCEDIWNSKGFIDVSTACRHRRVSFECMTHHLLCQGRLGRDVELLNTRLVLVKFPHDVMQVGKSSAQLCLRSKLVTWYWDATSVLFGHILFGSSPQREHRLSHWTNSGSVPSRLYIPNDWSNSKLWRHKAPPLAIVAIIFPQMRRSLLSVLPKKAFPVRLRMHMHSKSAQRKPARHKKTTLRKISELGPDAVFKKITWKQGRDVLISKNFTAEKVNTSRMITQFFVMEHFFSTPSGYNKCLTVQ